MKRVLKLLRNWLFTGLIVWIPFVLTAYIFYWAFNILDGWIVKLGIHVPGIGLAVLVLGTLVIGFAVSNYLGRKIMRLLDWLVERIPAVNIVYRTVRDLSHTLLNRDQSVFRAVVAIEFPHPGSYAIGFITGNTPAPLTDAIQTEMEMVFVMQAFSPATGFILAVPRTSIRRLDMSVEDAVKLILTGGIVRKALVED